MHSNGDFAVAEQTRELCAYSIHGMKSLQEVWLDPVTQRNIDSNFYSDVPLVHQYVDETQMRN